MRRRAETAPALVLSCEHGGARVPRPWRPLFAGKERLLASHRGFDPGALDLARALARRLRAPLVASLVTRLLADPNRSPGHRALHSRLVRESGADTDAIVRLCHAPHRAGVRRAIACAAGRSGRPVTHVAVHTFTPVLRGERRRADVGLLYDPSRERERRFAESWRGAIRRLAPALRVRRNDPYRGTSDGLPTAIRREIPDARYAGIELEVNQRFARRGGPSWARLCRILAESLAVALDLAAIPLPRRGRVRHDERRPPNAKSPERSVPA